MQIALTILLIWLAPAALLGAYLGWVILRRRPSGKQKQEIKPDGDAADDPPSIAAE